MKYLIAMLMIIGSLGLANAQYYPNPYLQRPQYGPNPYLSQSTRPNTPTTYQKMGNFTYGSDGTTTQRMGNFSYTTTPDGRNVTCQTIGQQTVCN